ncbi:DHA2 family efflux MFS transporter permease subunit [Streptomyces sp. ISL-43]|uniref:DHA2 family efflux MFS transporter permease subunit n=1 Tax=Streptomyces sp. ISL-43 TaxID=2819183 RepID=UPI001BE661F2|nr:DHA2 family efflux MFS transporter permease subunit [Streptomyces sp. ISL-43]MBT2449995.1 DHA2 family efflux MFS transporter permease subunit [Streptomyces sp. ISL-43]
MTSTTPDATRGKGLLLTFICIGIFMVYLDSTIVNVALPEIQQDLSADMTQLQWVINAYALVVACLLLTAGTLGDIFGRKRIFLGGLVGFLAASVLCAIAPNYEFLLVARVLQGAAGSIMIPVSLALVSTTYPAPAARARAIGIWAGIGGLALAAGPVLGGVLVDAFGWQSIFWVNLPFGLVALAVLAGKLAESKAPTRRRADVLGQILFIVAMASLVYGLIEASARGWSDSLILGSFGVALVALAAFVAWELRRPDPMLPMNLFRSPVLVVAGAVNFLGLFGLYGSIFLLTFYLQQVNGLSTTAAGVRFLALNVSIMVFSYIASVVAAKFGPKLPILIGSVASAVGLFELAQLEPGSGFGSYWWAMALLGAGVSLVGAPATVALLSSVRPEQAGTASGVSNTFRQVGSVFGVALTGTLLIQHLRDAVPDALKGVDLDPAARSEAVDVLSSGDLSVIAGLPAGARGPVRDAVAPIFTDGLQIGFTAAALGTIVGGLLALVILPGRKKMAAARAAAAAAAAPAPSADAPRAASGATSV